MSYRLIDSNAMQLRHPEVNDMPCIYADLSSGLDGGHYDMRESDELQRENAKLRELVNSYVDLFEKEAATNNGHGPYYSGEDWLVLANDMRVELAKCCGELGIEVDG